MTLPARRTWLATLAALGLLLALPAHGQSAAAGPSPGDTVRTSAPTALWRSADAVALATALPPATPLVVTEKTDRRLRVQSPQGGGWVSRAALDSLSPVVHGSASGRSTAAGVRPSWRARQPRRRSRALAIPRLALGDGRDGARIVSVLLSNPSRRTVTSVRLGLVLYDQAPDSTAQAIRRRTVRVVGPLEPRTLAAYDLRLPAPTHRPCVGVRRVRVERLNGTTVLAAPRRVDQGPGHDEARGTLPYAGDECLTEQASRPPRGVE
ncbi:hypothetical protein [Salinibacter altiplanensis]|uniref:hypothetical protein n=1 Tax=Salinibacter altiplanensis TaxID=1803181 RepID=UPI000C9EF86D|nr:hypothetical protein [Salinibacter altiplanensis]